MLLYGTAFVCASVTLGVTFSNQYPSTTGKKKAEVKTSASLVILRLEPIYNILFI